MSDFLRVMASQRRRFGQLVLLLLFISLPVAVQCQEESYEMEGQARQHLPQTSQQMTSKPLLVEPLYKFTANLFSTISDPKENVIFSPLSMHVALNMLSLGITKGSQTEKDMLETLGYGNKTTTTAAEIHETNAQLRSVFDEIKSATGDSRRNPKLDMVNFAICKSKSGIRPEYLDETNKYYGAAVRQVNNETDQQRVLDEVNKWGKDAGFSNNILPKEELDKSVLALVNGIRVEAFWFKSFHEGIVPDLSSPLYKHGVVNEGLPSMRSGKMALMASDEGIKFVEFTKNGQSKHSARNERSRAKQADHYDELAELEFRVMKISLIGDISYTIIEPLATNGSSKELAQLEEALLKPSESAGTTLSRMSKLMAIVDATSDVAANIRMPGFKYEQEIDLTNPLISMGLGRVFDAKTADLGNMSPSGNLYVDKVKHQAMIEVNEKGIKAAAVTKIMALLSAIYHNEVIEVNVENPFIYMIRLNKVPIFVGHLVKV